MENDDHTKTADASDGELLDRVRAGETRAFGLLWERHAGAALSVARGFTGLDADDIVSEAFERLLVSLQGGKGPRGAFRPYLITTVRNVGRSLYKRDVPRRDADFDLMIDADAIDGEHAAIRDQHHRAAEEAFRSLPPRWQEALWYSEVDGLPPREMSGPLGLSSNAISALVNRARKGFRDGWVSAQLARAASPECQAVIADIGAYTRDGLAPRASRKIEAHVATCGSCAAALKEAQGIAQTLAIAILPAVAGTAGAAGYVATLRPPAMPEMQLQVTTAAAGESGIEPQEAHPTRRRVVVIVALLLLLLIAAAIAVLAPRATEAEPDRGGAPAVVEEGQRDPVAPPTAFPSASPTPIVSPSPDDEARPRAGVEPPRRQPFSPLVPFVSPPAPAPGAGSPVPPAVPVVPDVLQPTLLQTDPRMYPRLRGDSAEPGALIRVLDSAGQPIGTTTADVFGRWSVPITSGGEGATYVSVTQTVRGITSQASATLPYSVEAPPMASRPLAGNVVNADRFNFRLDVPAGSVIQRSVVGQTPIQTLTVPASGVWNEYLAVPPGTHVLRLRWADPMTRDVGPWTEVTFTAE
ncbi:sigma-70 family RNA polymerase sigma factor [Microbacterium sp. 22179]|uniref:sigma-70 family RNA polymerase sigma factor n=1 Tax=Microbacterium sp. 22179 TaxID=3453886 RepID=UPI003F82CDDD